MDQNEQFFDKRDSKYIQLRSPFFFYEMCTKKKIKLELLTPQTIILDKGQPHLWLFNSSKSKTLAILKRNSDKLKLIEVTKSLLSAKNTDDWRIDTVQTLYESLKGTVKYANPEPVVYLRMNGNQRHSLTCSEFLKLLMDGKEIASIQLLQQYIPNHSIANEMYYCEYRNDIDMMPSTYKFYKKTVTKKKEPKKLGKSEPNPFQLLLRSSTKSPDKLLEVQEKKMVEVVFKYFDSQLNNKFQDASKKVVEFIVASLSIKVRKVICKFIVSKDGSIYFVGIKSLYIDLNDRGPYDFKQLSEELQSSHNREFEQFVQIMKMLRKQQKSRSKTQQLPDQIVDNYKTISSTLYKKLILEKCGGDFCEFTMVEKNKGPLQLRKGIQENYKSVFSSNGNTLENRQVHLIGLYCLSKDFHLKFPINQFQEQESVLKK